MEFVSILDYKRRSEEKSRMPAFWLDLNLDQVISQIQGLSAVPVEKYYYCLPEDREGEAYRRAVYTDVKDTQVNRVLTELVDCIEEKKQAFQRKQEVTLEVQRYVWHLVEVACYCEGYTRLYEGLEKASLASEGLLAFRQILKEYLSSQEFVQMREKARQLRDNLHSFRVKLVIDSEQIIVTEEAVEGTYENRFCDVMGVQTMHMKSPFFQSPNLSELEQEIIRKFAKKQPEFFEEIKDFYRKYQQFEKDVFLRFGEEISYYLSYYAFQQKMEIEGFTFTTPTVDEDKDMQAQGMYDLALACASLRTEKQVISNDVSYCQGESFLVVTGPNQGGKTTFARSLGQLIYLSKMGLDVPATVANVHYFTDIFTHFSVEESVESGRGKLMDELVRLKPMMHAECKQAFVIINELFTTAANYDACIMGKKVLEHFIAKGCTGIYVTHLKELTQAHESVVSMRAMLDDEKRQNFKICRQQAEDSVCAINQVNKYRLTYEQLKERLG